MAHKRILLALLVLVLLLGNVIFITKYSASKSQLANAEKIIEARSYNEKALTFTKMFIEKVLRAENEVLFNDRLELENAVREMKDEQVLAAWNQFVNSKTEIEAQEAVKDLLSLLIDKIKA